MLSPPICWVAFEPQFLDEICGNDLPDQIFIPEEIGGYGA